MFPIILVSKNKDKIDSFLDKFIKENSIMTNFIYQIFPIKKDLSIDQIRFIKKQIRISTVNTRLFILFNFQQATLEAQNALLKTLEEDSEENQFILITNNEHAILPTIQSRSKIVWLKKDKIIKNNMNKDFIKVLEQIHDSINYSFLADKNLTNIAKEQAEEYIELLITKYRAQLMVNPSVSDVFRKAFELKILLENNNLNPQLVLDNLLIFTFKRFRIKS